MRKQMSWWLLLVAPLVVGIASAQTVPPVRGWDVPPAGRIISQSLWWNWSITYPEDGGSYSINWGVSNFRDALTGYYGSLVDVYEYLPNWNGVRYLSCNIPGATAVHDGPQGGASVSVSIDVATYCTQSGFQWDPESETGGEWPFPATVDIEATVMYPDSVIESKSSIQVTTNSTGEKTYRHCNDEAVSNFAEGRFTLYGINRRIGPWTFPDGRYRDSSAVFHSSKCTNVGQ